MENNKMEKDKKRIQRSAIVLVLLKVAYPFLLTIVAKPSVMGSQTFDIFSIFIFLILAVFLSQGKKWPLYFWLIGSVANIIVITSWYTRDPILFSLSKLELFAFGYVIVTTCFVLYLLVQSKHNSYMQQAQETK